jgi:hypothetical protein
MPFIGKGEQYVEALVEMAAEIVAAQASHRSLPPVEYSILSS